MIRSLLPLHLGLVCVLLIVFTHLAGCDSSDAQDEFEDRAFARPFEGITSTTSDGDIVEEDEDDWQVGPLYINSVDVVAPAYPNPTAGEQITIEINVLFDDALRGQLALYGYTDTEPRRLRLIDLIPESTQAGFYPFRFSPTVLSQEPGIRRVFVFDSGPSRQELVTYGDVLLE